MAKDFHLNTKTKKISKVLNLGIDSPFMVHKNAVRFIEDTFEEVLNQFIKQLGDREDCQVVVLCDNSEKASSIAEGLSHKCKDMVIFDISSEEDMDIFIEIYSGKNEDDDFIRLRNFFIFENFKEVKVGYRSALLHKVEKVINKIARDRDSYLYFTVGK